MSKKLYVGNLAFSITQDALKEAFTSFGEIEEVTLVQDRETGRSRGFGFVTFVNDADADKALAEMNGKELEGRAIKVSEARPPGEGGGGRRRGGFGGGGFRRDDW
jgi:RNA recognition motif-containing protein